jgi:hypothetical protein
MTIRVDFIRPVPAGNCEFADRFFELRKRGFVYVVGSQHGDERGGYILMAPPAANRLQNERS